MRLRMTEIIEIAYSSFKYVQDRPWCDIITSSRAIAWRSLAENVEGDCFTFVRNDNNRSPIDTFEDNKIDRSEILVGPIPMLTKFRDQ